MKRERQVTVIDSDRNEAFKCHPGLARLILKRNLARVIQSEPHMIIQLFAKEDGIPGFFPPASRDSQSAP